MKAQRSPQAEYSFSFKVHGTPTSVRTILADLRQRLADSGVVPDQCGTIEIAVAEALNNIVEHAYAPSCEGPLWLSATISPKMIEVKLRDRGNALPGLQLPRTDLPDASGPLETLPEGGFGWYLIHDLTNELSYVRQEGENHLLMSFMVNSDSSQ